MATPRSNKKLGLVLAAMVAGMIALSFAAVPFYRMFCEATGFGGATRVASAAPAAGQQTRSMTVHFNTDTQPGLPIAFQAVTAPLSVKLGDTAQALFRMKNEAGRPVTVVAAYNVTPPKLGVYFNKVQCFCFEPHTLAPGQQADFPVLFFIDPAAAADPHLGDVSDVTLSYSLFEEKGTADKAANSR